MIPYFTTKSLVLLDWDLVSPVLFVRFKLCSFWRNHTCEHPGLWSDLLKENPILMHTKQTLHSPWGMGPHCIDLAVFLLESFQWFVCHASDVSVTDVGRPRRCFFCLGLFGFRCSFADLGICESLSPPCDACSRRFAAFGHSPIRPNLWCSSRSSRKLCVGNFRRSSDGIFFHSFWFFGALCETYRTDELDGAKWGSFGGLVMPSFFFQGAADIYNNVRIGADEARKTFQETGRFEDIYQGIGEAQKEQVLQGLDALCERFPPSKSRERIFERLKGIANNSRFAASVYDLALRLQPPHASSEWHW